MAVEDHVTVTSWNFNINEKSEKIDYFVTVLK